MSTLPLELMTKYSNFQGAKKPVDSLLCGFRLKSEPIAHRRFREGMFRLAELHHGRQAYGMGGGLLIIGHSGGGKSTLLEHYESKHPRVHEKGITRIPVLRVSVPSSPSAKSLAEAILVALKDPKAHRGTASEKTERILIWLERCGVELILFDEFQHLFYTATVIVFRDVTDWLKRLISNANVGIVACGLPEAALVVDSNEQLARRFCARIQLTPFSMDDDDDFIEFRGLLRSFQKLLPIPVETPLFEANLARRMYIASYGLLDYLGKVLEGAVSVAVTARQPQIDLPVLAAAFRNRIWSAVPDRLNPFYPESILRPLDRVGEVFYLHTQHNPVGSPLARRIGLKSAKGGAQ
ncbi:TniB family NTP-binding protein [Azonexus sp. IMCC34842]|uniref:TniB family NTP-binding protein n=1 Tax=Azonexus sp. IMCC34842 TaxID=3420950 RepID=UPI003D12DE8B